MPRDGTSTGREIEDTHNGVVGALRSTHANAATVDAEADRFAGLVREFQESEYYRRTLAMLASVRN